MHILLVPILSRHAVSSVPLPSSLRLFVIRAHARARERERERERERLYSERCCCHKTIQMHVVLVPVLRRITQYYILYNTK